VRGACILRHIQRKRTCAVEFQRREVAVSTSIEIQVVGSTAAVYEGVHGEPTGTRMSAGETGRTGAARFHLLRRSDRWKIFAQSGRRCPVR
jgi:hypothetical protein